VQSKSQQLANIKKSLKEKELEKDRLIFQKNIFKKEVKSLNNNIEKTNEKLMKYSMDIKTTLSNLENSSERYKMVASQIADLNHTIISEIKFFNKMTFRYSYEQNPLEYKIMRKLLDYRGKNLEKTKKIAAISKSNVKKFERSKKELLSLQQSESKLAKEHRNMLQEKSKSLEIASGKILSVEQEIKALSDSAKALQNLINKISQQKSATRPHATAASEIKRKKIFSWPAKGKVVVNFGKNKHPELDTYIISNGIKISASDSNEVKSIYSGVVVFAGQFRSYGKVIIIDHKDSIFAVYGLLDKILVKEEQKVLKDSVIAELGSGKSNILYLEIRYKNIPDDPLLWLQ
jgi:septal ring factor EnvC (AmiA/AmiB activator)